jgi:hypothetical protein
MPLSRMPKPTTGRARASIWALTLFLLDKEAKLSCLLLQRPLELDPHPGPDQ